MTNCQIIQADAIEGLRQLPDNSVQCCVTSPPYWGLRDYGHPDQIGLEATPEEWCARLVAVFREVRRVLTKDGTCWVNLGDCYNGAGLSGGTKASTETGTLSYRGQRGGGRIDAGLKPKDLIGQPWMFAFAARADGWYLRQEIIWHKSNPMPESVNDRCTKAHESIFLLTKSPRYYFDADAIREPVSGTAHSRGNGINPKARQWKTPDGWDTSTGNGGHGSFHKEGREKGKSPGKNSRIYKDRDPANARRAKKPRQNESFSAAVASLVDDRNKRSVWRVATAPYKEAHFATYPPALIRPCILAGTRPGDVVLDPFAGSGTTGEVALDYGRSAILIELNPEYLPLINRRTRQRGLAL